MVPIRAMTISKIATGWRCARLLSEVTKENQHMCRHFSVNQIQYNKSALKKEEAKFRDYILSRYMAYVKNYETHLEKRFPAAMNVYRIFSIGIKDFYKDLKTYISLRLRVVGDKGLNNCSRQEIELYCKMPQDMVRIAPVLILSAIPFGNYLIFPLALFKPRTLLCSHFWSVQQRAEFSVLDLKERLIHNKPVFRALQAEVITVKDENLKQKWSEILGLLGSGLQPKPNDVVECKALFAEGIYHLNNISYGHAGHLLKMHGLRKGIFRRKKLRQRAFLLHQMDHAIAREGGPNNLSTESLRNACLIRGLNSTHLTNNDMINWLEQWLAVSKLVDKNNYSLLLHCPILFAYNHPQNWMLIY